MKRIIIGRCLLLAFIFLASATLVEARLLVISPHPDDELIVSAGVIYRALQRGEQVRVVYLTNGDYSSAQNGYTREGEAVAGEATLGLSEDNLIFLGYPDGYTSTVFNSYTTANSRFVTPLGVSATYANRGLGRTDYHSYRFGSPAPYNRVNMLADLQSILATYLPDQIVVTSQYDVHPDHATSYYLATAAIAAVHRSNTGYQPVLNTSIVHCSSGSSAWPNPIDPGVVFSPVVGQTGFPWSSRESLQVPLLFQSADYTVNPKYLAIATHQTQGGATSFLGNFIHKDEFFWTENPAGTNAPPIVNAGPDQIVSPGAKVYLDGTQSKDPEGATLTFHWLQRTGTLVTLSDPGSATPYFTAPTGLSQDDTLSFELVVSDGQLASLPDAVSVKVLSEPNIAPLATVTASSQDTADGQGAAKAVDGVIDGYPGDSTKEWATMQEKAGAWLKLVWSAPYSVDRVILYDRPNLEDQITGATLTFSDGSSVTVGPLNNNGTATEVKFPAKTTTSLTMTVTSTSSTTWSVGLAEIQVLGVSATGTQYILKAAGSPIGAGTVSVAPLQQSYSQGQQATLTAFPSAGYGFSNWSGDATGALNPLTLTMNSNRNVVANFTLIPGTLAVTPSGGFSSTGMVGGPFNPSSVTYTLQNSGSSSINWSSAATQGWVSLSSSGGTLAPGSTGSITASINSGALSLAAGSYSDTVSFTNLSNGNGSTSRAVSLAVSAQSSNVAPLAVATASSETPQYGQTAAKAIDGVIDGYPGDYTREWASAGEKAGAWLRLNWNAPYGINRVILYDRPNLNDNITSATLTFSDGSTIAAGPLNNNGVATEVDFPARIVTSMTMTVNGTSASTTNAGLAEIQVYGSPASLIQYTLGLSATPTGGGTVVASPNQTSYYQGTQVTLTATPSTGYTFSTWSGDASGTTNPLLITMDGNKSISASFTPIPGTLSASPATGLVATGAPGGPFSPASTSYTLTNTGSSQISWSSSATQNWLTLSSGSGTLVPGGSTAVTVSINGNAASLTSGTYSDTVNFINVANGNGNTAVPVTLTVAQVNIAPLATVTASSQTTQYGQTAVKAVDGVIDGYPGDYTREWASAGEKTGAWLSLAWSVPHTINRIVLYDRPNTSDNIQSATITFSDGSALAVGPLNNNGTATSYSFPAKTVTGLTLSVTGVSSATQNVGLSEIQVY